MNPSTVISIVTEVLLFISFYFEVFMLTSLLERRSLKTRDASILLPDTLPSVCIVVPCYNEEHTVGGTIRSLLALEYPRELLQVVVVDDGSTDHTFANARAFESDPRVRVFHKENGGKHSALNYALAETGADLIGCLDADSTVAPDALSRMVAVFADPIVDAVTPGIHIMKPTNLLQHLQKAEYRLAIFTRAAFADSGSTFITPGPFSIFRAGAVRSAGGWKHAHSTEDLELGLRLQERGSTIRNEPYASVYTKTPRTLRALMRQRIRWTYGFICNAIDYRHMLGNARYGNLGLLVLPTALLSVGIVFYFMFFILIGMAQGFLHAVRYMSATGSIAWPSFDLFYVNTSMVGFVIYLSVLMIVLLLAIGSRLGNKGERGMPLIGMPLFILFYGFLTSWWLAVAVLRATFRTGVRWK